MAIEFHYKEEESKITEKILRPIGDVQFKAKNDEWVEAHLYIDSGADISLIPFSLGKLLGFKIDEDKIQELRGIGEGVVSVVIKKVQIKIGEYEMLIRVAWALIEEVTPLLGRLDIFNKFKTIFDEDEKKIIFEKKSQSTFEKENKKSEILFKKI